MCKPEQSEDLERVAAHVEADATSIIRESGAVVIPAEDAANFLRTQDENLKDEVPGVDVGEDEHGEALFKSVSHGNQ